MRMLKKCSTGGGGSDGAEKVAGILDLLWEILILLPLKSLIRSKCVSKQWLKLISDQQFRDSHRDKHQRYNTCLIFNPKPCGRIPMLQILCHGVCSFIYIICNPITREFTSLTLPSWLRSILKRSLYLAFNPFQIISVAAVNESLLDWVFNVYSFKSRSWIHPESQILLSTPFELDFANGVYWNHAIHWCNRGNFFIYFHVDTHCLQNLPIPPAYWLRITRRLHYFGESGGRLHMMLSSSLNLNFDYYDIFELKEDYSEWTLRHRFDLNSLHREIVDITWSQRYELLLGFYIVRAAKNHLLVLIAGRYGAIVYDPVDETSRKLCDFEFGCTSSFFIQNSFERGQVLQYFENNESLVELASLTNQK